jgi:hypothetical protein
MPDLPLLHANVARESSVVVAAGADNTSTAETLAFDLYAHEEAGYTFRLHGDAAREDGLIRNPG